MVEIAIRRRQAGEWTLQQMAQYLGCSRKHAFYIARGMERREAMRNVDPSSLAPSYMARTRATACAYCDTGNTWVKYVGVMDTLGQLTFQCPNCGRAAV